MSDAVAFVESSGASRDLVVRALGRRAEAALDSEVNLLGYVSPMTRQQVALGDQNNSAAWRTTAAAVDGVEFQDCLLSRQGELVLPRIPGGFLAAISHPWSGMLEISTDQGDQLVDLFCKVTKVVAIDTSNGVIHDFAARELIELRQLCADAMSDPSLADQREVGEPRQPPSASPVVSEQPVKTLSEQQMLGRVTVHVTGRKSESSLDEMVLVVEVEPIAGLFAELGRLDRAGEWDLQVSNDVGTADRTMLGCRSGQLRINAAQNGSIVFLCGPEAGIVEIEIFGSLRELDLYSPISRLLRIDFDEGDALSRVTSLQSPESEALRHRRDFYTAALRNIDSSRPIALYVPRWKGVAASTKNLFEQTLPFPHTAEGHPSDVMPEDVKFLVNTLLASGGRHFIVSGGDTFWISVIRRVQWEDPGIRFDLLWHSNYLQMGEPHDWNLLKNWLRAIADGMVTRVAVVKSGLELLFKQLGIDAVFIPNVLRTDPASIRYNGSRDLLGIWLSGSSSYRKVPYAALLALRSLPRFRLIGAGFDDDSLAMVTELHIPRGEIWREPLPQEALHREIQRTGLTFYVTLSECSPMLPLESLNLGVPCLVGACSHLFRSSPYLYKTLVVENPLSPESIARHARLALAEGSSIIDAFVEYSHDERKQAAEALGRFLS